MILAIDVGNTNIVLGAYKNGKFAFVARISTDPKLEADQYALQLGGILELYGLSGKQLSGVVMCCVVPPLTKVLKQALAHFTQLQVHLLCTQDAGQMQICINTPPQLGTDLLASAIAIYGSCPMPAVIVDIGTATKFIALDKNGNLQGVSIAPGPVVSLGALLQNTSLLNSVALHAPKNAIGKNTTESMQSGIVLGTACMIDGMISLFETELGEKPFVVATGGASSKIIPCCKTKIQQRQNLILEGLVKAYKQQNTL